MSEMIFSFEIVLGIFENNFKAFKTYFRPNLKIILGLLIWKKNILGLFEITSGSIWKRYWTYLEKKN